MVNHLKFRETEDSKVYFVSDLHYKHSPQWDIPIWKQRGFNSSDEHCDGIIKNHNNVVTNNDICFFLGDSVIGAGADSTQVFKNLFQNCLNYKTAYIMPGNHWAGYRTLFNSALEAGNRIDEFYRLKIDEINGREVYFIPNYYEIIMGYRLFVMSHYPILSWHDHGKGSIMLFGHVHNNLRKTDWIKDNYLKGKTLDISWDCYQRPLSSEEILKMTNNKKILKIDHH